MMDDVSMIIQNATIGRMEVHEYNFEQNEGLEKLREEKAAFQAVEEILKKMPPEEVILFHEYLNASASEEADRNYYLYQAGFKDGVKALKEILKW